MSRLIGRYEVLAEIGRGGFGHVYRGLDPTVGRHVAIKTLASDGDAGMLTRFRNEATASGRLRHPNIVTIYDFGEQDGMPYIVMELLEGHDLQQIISGAEPVSPLNKVRIMTQIAAGLQHAHNHGIIHRDVKPANVMVLPDGSVKIMDFGIALVTQATESRLTPRGAMIGTFRYMAPEQFRSAQTDARSDIFAYGLIFYELLSGVHPFHAADAGALMFNILSIEPVPIGELVPDCPKELQAVIARLLSKDPEARYQNLDDVLFDIEPALGELRRKRAQELLSQAQTAKSAQRFDTAQELVREILELTPGDEGARRLREGIQIELRRQAIRPKVDALIKKGQDALAAGKPADAVERFESAIRLADVPEVVPLLEAARAEVARSKEATRLASEAEAAFKSGDAAGAAGLSRQALEILPTEPLAKRILAESEAALSEDRRRGVLAEGLERAQRLIDIRSWDEAAAVIAKIDQEFPRLPEVAALTRKRWAGWIKEERERLLASDLASARKKVQQGDLTGALATLEKLAAEYADSSDVQKMLVFVKQELETQTRREFVKHNIEEANTAAGQRQFERALSLLDAALTRYPGNPDLQRQRRSIAAEQRETERRAAAEKSIAAANTLRSKGSFPEALSHLDDFLAAHGDDTAIGNLRDAILKDQETSRRAAELHEFVHRARNLMAEGRVEDATTLLRTPPSHLKGHPEVTELLGAAKLQLQAQAGRKAQLAQTLANTIQLQKKDSFDEALQVLDAYQKQYGEDTQVEQARRQVKLAEHDKAARELLAQGTALLSQDPAGATRLFAAAPEDIRQQPEIQQIERAALRALDLQKARQTAAETAIVRATELRSQGRFSDALTPLDDFLASHGAEVAIADLREAILKDQEDARRTAELQGFVQQAKDLMARGRADEAVAVLRAAPPDLQEDPGITQLLAAAQLQVQQAAERAQAAKELVARATTVLANDPAGVTALLGAAPDYLRERPEIQSLERAAAQAIEDQQARESEARLIHEVRELCAQEKFAEALSLLGAAMAKSSGNLAPIRQEVLLAKEAHESKILRQQTIDKIHTLLAANRYEDANRALSMLLSREPANEELLWLQEDAKKRQEIWLAEQKERSIRETLARAKDALAEAPGDVVRMLETLNRDHPNREDILAARLEAQEAFDRRRRRDLLREVEALCQRNEFDAALSRLKDIAPADVELIRFRDQVTSRRQKALDRQVAEAVQLAANLRESDAKRALKELQSLPQTLQNRPEVQAASEECRQEIIQADRKAAVAAIEELCTRGKFRKARVAHAGALDRFGSDPRLDALSAEIETGLQRPRSAIWAKPAYAIVGIGAAVALGVVVWIYVHQSASPVAILMPVEIRTEPAGARVQLGDRACQTPNCNFDLPAGTYQVQSQLDGYKAAVQTVTVGVDKHPYSFSMKLEPLVIAPVPASRATGTLVVQASTPDASVFVDNNLLGRTDRQGRFSSVVEASPHAVRVEKTGYQTPQEQTIRVESDGSQTIAFNLVPQAVKLESKAAPDVPEVTSAKSPVAAPTPAKADSTEQDWELAHTTSDPAQVQAYLDKYPNSRHTGEAQARIESLSWQRVDQHNPQSLRDYLGRFRGGAHENEARLRIAELAWAGTNQKDEQSLRAFIQQNPDSPRRTQAQSLIDELVKQQRAKDEDAKKQLVDGQRAQVLAVLSRFNDAFATGKRDQQRQRELKAVWPDVPKSILDAATTSHTKLVLDAPQIDNITSDTASLICNLTAEGPQSRAPQRVKIMLQKRSNDWTIRSVNAN